MRKVIKKGIELAIVVFVICVLFPSNVKAAETITGGKTREDAVEIEAGKEYTTTTMEGWFKIITAENTQYIGIGRDEYTNLEIYDSISASEEINADDYCYDTRTLWKNGRTVYYRASEYKEYYFYFSTSKAENCNFKVICSIAFPYKEEARTLELNTEYSHTFDLGGWEYENYYKFVAPTSGTYRLSCERSGMPSDGYVHCSIEYKDGTSICSVGRYEKSVTFDVKQGMSYYVCISPDCYADVTFSVSNLLVSDVVLNMTSLELCRGEQFLLEAEAFPENAVVRTVSFTSSNPTVASVSDDGWVTAKNAGTAVITATADDGSGVSTSCIINIKKTMVNKIELEYTNLDFDMEKNTQYKGFMVANVYPEDATDKTVSYTSSNSKVAVINKTTGDITVKSVGTTVLTCTANDGSGVKKTCTLRVKASCFAGAKATIDGIRYKVTSNKWGGGTVSVVGVNDKTETSYEVPSTVEINGYKYKVEEIGNKAFNKCQKATQITVGANVKKIGTQAFYNCKKLKNVTIKSKNLKSVGKNSFKNIHSKAKIKVPSSKLKKYKKLLENKGQKKSVKVTKI